MIINILFLLIVLLITPYAFGQSSSTTDIKVIGNYYEERKIEISVFLNEKENYTLTKILQPHQSIPESFVLKNGNIILIHSLEGIAEIYDKSGNIIFRDEYYKLPPYKGQKLFSKIWSEGFLIVVSEEKSNNLYLHNTDGYILSHKNLEQGMISGIELSENGELLAYSTVNWLNDELLITTILLSLNGNYYKRIPKLFENGVFNNDLSLFVGWEKRHIFCIDIINKTTLWESGLESNQLISQAIIKDTETYILISNNPVLIENKWEYDKIKIISKNPLGDERQLFQHDLRASDIKFISKGGESILIINKKEFKINEN